MKGVEDLNIRITRAQGIVGGGAIPLAYPRLDIKILETDCGPRAKLRDRAFVGLPQFPNGLIDRVAGEGDVIGKP